MTETANIRVARFYGAEDIRFDSVTSPRLGEGEVRLQVAFDGVCGTDLHQYFDPEHSVVPMEYDANGKVVPMRLGHEYSGTVLEIGTGVTRVAVGDRVAVFPVAYCGQCAACKSGAPSFTCTNQGPNPGGIGEQDVRHERHLHKLPASVSLLHGALVEPMAVSFHGVRLADPAPDHMVVIAGAGPIGVGVYLALRARGVENVLVSEPSAQRRAVIEALGAVTIDPVSADLAAEVQRLSGGQGAAVFFDAAGAGPVFEQGVNVLGAFGQYVVIAVHAKPVSLDAWSLQIFERRIVGSIIYTPQDFDEVIALMADGAYPTDGWVTVRPAEEIAEVMAELKDGKGTKVLLEL